MLQRTLWESDPEAWLGLQTAEPDPLRGYQSNTIAALDGAIAAGKTAPILCLPTGGGKTRVAAELINRASKRNKPTLFLAPRRELVYQASRALSRCGVVHGVVMSGRSDLEDKWALCQVASIDTLHARLKAGSLSLTQDFHMVIVDEAHLAITEKKVQMLRGLEADLIVGLTATPSRKDGRALGFLFDHIIEEATTASLTADGFLTSGRYFSLPTPDLSKVKITAGDYNAKALEKVMNTGKLVGDIVEHWLRLASDRRTVVFATSIAHSAALAEEFKKHGIAAEHVDAETPNFERAAIFGRFSNGRTQVLCNCFLAAYGFDLPELDCVVLARPTKSLVLYLQSVGRGLRIAEGKSDCLVLDHSGAVHRFGFPTDPRSWSLNGKVIWGDTRENMRSLGMMATMKCQECGALYKAKEHQKCPECGWIPKTRGHKVHTIDGQLVEVGAKPKGKVIDKAARQRFYFELCGLAKERRYAPGWAAHKFKEKFGSFPPRDWGRYTLPPSDRTRGWVKSRQIAFYRAKEKKEKALAKGRVETFAEEAARRFGS